MQGKPPINPLLFPVLLVNFIGALGFSIVLPFLVIIVLKLGGNAIVYGLLGATYSLFQLIGAPVLGARSDRYGRRKILLVSMGGTVVAWIIFLIGLLIPDTHIHFSFESGLVVSVPLILIFLARAMDGITGGNISVANAYLADISSKSDRKQNFGKMSAAANLGLIFGPLLAGLLGATAWGNILPVIATIFISLSAIFVIFFQLKDPPARQSTTSPSLGFFAALKLPYVPIFLFLYFLIFLAFNFFYAAFPVYVAGKLHWSVLQLGVFFAVLSGLLVLVQGPLLAFCASRFSGAALVISGTLLLGIGFVLFTYTGNVIIYTGVVFFALGNGLMWPSFIGLLSTLGSEQTQGAIQGFASSAGSLASIIGLVTGAVLYHSLGAHVFFLTSILLLIIAIISIKLIRIEREVS